MEGSVGERVRLRVSLSMKQSLILKEADPIREIEIPDIMNAT